MPDSRAAPTMKAGGRIVRSAWFHFERVGRVSILHVSGYIDRDVQGRFERTLREAAVGPPDSVLVVSLLKCSSIDYSCLLVLSRLSERVQAPVHIIAAPGTDTWRKCQLPEFSGVLSFHDGFREAFFAIVPRSSSTKHLRPWPTARMRKAALR